MANLYRYQEILYTDSKLMLRLDEFPIIKETNCGNWIDNFGKKKFVLFSAKKQYACKTREEAYQSYLARKKRQLRILQANVRRVEAALELTPERLWSFF